MRHVAIHLGRNRNENLRLQPMYLEPHDVLQMHYELIDFNVKAVWSFQLRALEHIWIHMVDTNPPMLDEFPPDSPLDVISFGPPLPEPHPVRSVRPSRAFHFTRKPHEPLLALEQHFSMQYCSLVPASRAFRTLLKSQR